MRPACLGRLKVMELNNCIAVVTGGGMGIGKAVAQAFAEQGTHVALFDIDPDAARRTAEEVEKLNCRSLVCEVDVSDPVAVDRGVDQVLQEFGRIDILVNNAGTTHPSESIVDLDLKWLEKVAGVDFNGVYFCSRRIGKEMISRNSGAIVNIASICGLASTPLPVYGPMKSAVIMLTQVLARDWAGKGVRVNAVAPAHVLTPLLQSLIDKGMRNPDTILKNMPMGRFIMPSDVADAVVFLCSDKARSITGATLPVDGGFLSSSGWKLYGYD